MAKHIVHNNLIPRKDILDPFKRRLMSKRKAKKKAMIGVIEEVDERSESLDKKMMSSEKEG